MELIERDGLDLRGNEGGDFLINPTEATMKRAKEIGVRNIELNDSLWRVKPDLRFLSSYAKYIEGVAIVMMGKINISFISDFVNLRTLKLTRDFNQEVDFEKFPQLENCHIDWNRKFKNIDKATSLKALGLWHYRKKDLTELKSLTQLTNL